MKNSEMLDVITKEEVSMKYKTMNKIDSLTKDELWEVLFSSEDKAEQYNQKFSYDDMKIMFSLYEYKTIIKSREEKEKDKNYERI